MVKVEKQEENKNSPEFICRLYKFHKQKTIPVITDPISLGKIRCKTFFKVNKKCFKKISDLIIKYKIDSDNFIQHCIFEIHVSSPNEILNVQNFISYANKLKVEKQYKKIYDNFIKSCNYIADNCIKEKLTPKEYLKKLISEKRLAIEYMCGNISTHFLASINGIKNIFKYLDNNSKDELSIIYTSTEKLNGDIQEAFLKYKKHKVAPLKFIENIIYQKQNNIK